MPGRLFAFLMISVNGYMEDHDGSLAWAELDEGFHEHSISQLNDVGGLVFGRKTYEGMVAYWPDQGAADLPAVAEHMHALPKYVISTTLDGSDWNNTTVIGQDVEAAIKTLKDEAEKDLAIFGSSALVSSLVTQGLVDELRLMVMPVVLPAGRPILAELSDIARLDLVRATTFRSGNALLCYGVRV